MTYYSSRGIIMSDIQELEAKLVQSQKKLNDLQYEVNAIHMELVKLKAENPQPQAAQRLFFLFSFYFIPFMLTAL